MSLENLPNPPQVSGISLSGTEPYVIATDENRALCDLIGVAPAVNGWAHPIYFFIATQVGMGMTVPALCRICDFDVADGPMMVSSKVKFSRRLMTEQAYWVTGEILGLTRKLSRKLGVMDMLDYELRLALPDGSSVLKTANIWVLPRRNLR
jgi:hypothetical protein